MMLRCSLGIFTLMFLALGCQSPAAKTATTAPASTDQIEAIRQSLRSQGGKVDVGVVVDVLPSEQLAAIGDMDLSSIHVDETICFMDSTQKPLVCGKVVRVTDSQVHVKYENPTADLRAPVRGDIAVAFH